MDDNDRAFERGQAPENDLQQDTLDGTFGLSDRDVMPHLRNRNPGTSEQELRFMLDVASLRFPAEGQITKR